MPKFNDGDAFDEEPIDMDELVEQIVEKATTEDIIDHIKSGFKTLGIEGTEDVFRRVYAKHPQVVERYQAIYDKLIGRKK